MGDGRKWAAEQEAEEAYEREMQVPLVQRRKEFERAAQRLSDAVVERALAEQSLERAQEQFHAAHDQLKAKRHYDKEHKKPKKK